MKKILISSNMVLGSLGLTYSQCFEKLGLNVIKFDDSLKINLYIRILEKISRNLISKKIQKDFFRIIIESKPDIVFIFKGFHYSPSLLSLIKKKFPKMIFIYFNPDNPFNNWHYGNTNNWIIKSMPIYDIHFTWGLFLIDKLKKYGARNVHYLPFASDENLHYPVSLTKEEYLEYKSEICFIGSWDKEREKILNNLLHYDIKIWGNGWHKANSKLKSKWQNKEVVGKKFIKVCSASKINLNLVRKQNIPSHNMRTFELPACKVFSINTNSEEHSKFFVRDREQITFTDTTDLLFKINKYLKDDNKRNFIAENGRKNIVQNAHNYLERSKYLMNLIQTIKT
jgi:spore maturation protein CgeB